MSGRGRGPESERVDDALRSLPHNADDERRLLDEILVDASGPQFFRTLTSWSALAAALRELLLRRSARALRVRCARCASGEEAFTVAMILAELVGIDQLSQRVTIYATDIDDRALHRARAAVYHADDVAGVPELYRAQYFMHASDDLFALSRGLRRAVVFGRHDLGRDPFLSRIDVLVCRYTLTGLEVETYNHLLARSESAVRDRRLFDGPGTPPRDGLWRRALARVATAVVVLDERCRLAQVDIASEWIASEWIGLVADPLGRPFDQLPLVRAVPALRAAIERACADRCSSRVASFVLERRLGESITLEADICALEEEGRLVGIIVSLVDITRESRLEAEVRRAHTELETAYDELRVVRELLDTTTEELRSRSRPS